MKDPLYEQFLADWPYLADSYGLTGQSAPPDGAFEDWKIFYEMAHESIKEEEE